MSHFTAVEDSMREQQNTVAALKTKGSKIVCLPKCVANYSAHNATKSTLTNASPRTQIDRRRMRLYANMSPLSVYTTIEQTAWKHEPIRSLAQRLAF